MEFACLLAYASFRVNVEGAHAKFMTAAATSNVHARECNRILQRKHLSGVCIGKTVVGWNTEWCKHCTDA